MSDDLTGRRLGHYRVDGVIGRGGMSVMYRATDVRLGRKVALKVIAGHLSGDPEFRERFADEARNTSAIDHSHVVPLYDFGESDGLLYIAMRYVEGPDLASLIRQGPLAPTRALALLDQVAEALHSMHARGLVHLDVKPANVLVTTRESAGTEHVYLADFGLTRRGATGHRTVAGDFLGSPTYAAPEHLRGEPVDARTDQYALACVLFACLTGRAPFRGPVQAVMKGHLAAPVPSASALVSALPKRLDEVLRRGMAKDPAARYRSCRELIQAARVAVLGPVGRVAGMPAPAVDGPPGPGEAAGSPGPAPPPPAPSLGQAPLPGGQAPPPGGARGSWAPPAPWAAGPEVRPGGVPLGDPVRLRDPLPAKPVSFAPAGGIRSWVLPLLLAAAGAAIVLLLAVAVGLAGGGADEGFAPPPAGAPAGSSLFVEPPPEAPVRPA